MAVVAAGELDDLRALGERARDPQRAHRRLGAGAHEAHELDARHRVADEPRELELERARRAVARPAAHRLLERRDHTRMRVAEDQRPPGEDVVEIAVAVDVDEVRALAALDEERVAADRAERAHRRARRRRASAREPRRRAARRSRASSGDARERLCERARGFLAGVDAVGDADSAIRGSGERKPGMVGRARRRSARAARDGRGRTAAFRAASGGRESAGAPPRSRAAAARSGRARRALRRSPRVTSRPPKRPANTRISTEPLGRATLPLARRPAAREHVRALGARHEVAVAVQRMCDVFPCGTRA